MHKFRSMGVFGLVWLAVGAGCAYAVDGGEKLSKVETVVIPLDQIWAYGMPGTRDVRTLVDMKQVTQSLGMRVGGPPSFISHKGEKIAGPGFAVLGTGMEALLATHAELPEGEKYPDTFPFGSEISVVFFSHGFDQYVHLHRVERQGNVITIRYRFVPHLTKNFSDHFALIPVSKLRPGKVQVNIVRTSRKGKYVVGGWKPTSAEEERRIACKSFSFSISAKK